LFFDPFSSKKFSHLKINRKEKKRLNFHCNFFFEMSAKDKKVFAFCVALSEAMACWSGL